MCFSHTQSATKTENWGKIAKCRHNIIQVNTINTVKQTII